MMYYATLSRFSDSIFFDTARVVTWHNALIKQHTMRIQKLLNSASPRALTQINTLGFANCLNRLFQLFALGYASCNNF